MKTLVLETTAPFRGLPELVADNEGLFAAEDPKFDHIGVLGHVGWLMTRDAELRDLFINDMEWRIMPPVALNQFKLWRQGNRPVAYASWAYVGERQLKRIQAGNKRLSPAE